MIGATTPEGNEPPQRDERIPSRIATGRARWRLRRLAHMSKNRWCFDTFLRSVDPGDRSRRRVARRIRNVVDAGIAKRRTAAVYLGQLCDAGVLDEVKVGREKLFINPRRVTPSLLPQSERPDLPQSAEHQIRRAVRVLGVVQVAREDVFKIVAGIGVVGTPVRFPRNDCPPARDPTRRPVAISTGERERFRTAADGIRAHEAPCAARRSPSTPPSRRRHPRPWWAELRRRAAASGAAARSNPR